MNENFWLPDGDGIDYEMAPRCFRRMMDRKADRQIAVMETGRSVCFGGKGGGDSPSPDPQIGQAALKQAEIAGDWLDFAREQFEIGNIRQEEMDALTKQVTNEQLDQMRSSGDRSDQQWADYNTTYRPIEKMNVLDALGGQYLSDDQVRAYLGKQDDQARARLDAQHQSNLTAIQSLGSGKTAIEGSPGLSPDDARALASSMVGTAPTRDQFTTRQSSYYFDETNSPVEREAKDVFDQAGYDAALSSYNKRASDLAAKLTGMGQVEGSPVEFTEEERQKLIAAERARYDAAKKANVSVTDEVMMARDASRKAQENAAGEAKVGIMQAADQQKQVAGRQMAAMGINPNSGRFAGIDRSMDRDIALASAGAQNNARNMVRNQGMALRADQANYGRGGSTVAAQQLGLGLNAGNAAVGNTGAANANWFQNNQVMAQGFGGAMQGYQNQAGILNGLYGNNLQGHQINQQSANASAAGTGQLIGAGVGAYATYAGLAAF
jgi:hypothetical protein